ncbi:Coiled-coil domain-containing protein 77 [Mus musculus] [Rhizoctonia solani]|uniref:Coiled-coil domain-containing protein 77 [Mus musculus] n=1 Tax=Rhizoctonia solani TaxID=456999 RepID=A0A0K6FLP0_9AGAM|nr:Coiled-coil domain-containing protein 77 [Mus musculus] [Rhizoctonia solani]
MPGMRADRLEEEGTAASPTELQRPPTPGQQPSSPAQDRPQKQTPTIDIMHVLVLGPSGSGKSSLINLLSGEKLPVASEGAGLCTINFRITHAFTLAGRSFRLIDSPGLYITSLSTSDIMKKLILYLARFRDSKGPPNLSGILYLHPEGKDIRDEDLKRTLEALRRLVGDPWLSSVTVAVIGDGATTVSSDTISKLQEPTSPFYSLYCGGAKIVPLSFELSRIQEIMLAIEPSSSQPRFFNKISWDPQERHVGGIDELMGEIMGPNRRDHTGRAARPRKGTQMTLEESEINRQQLQATLEATETELKLSRSQLAQIQEEYASLRSELQLHDNTEQSKVVQSLQDLNRAIDNFGRSVAEYMVDNFAATLNKDDPTTLDASDLPELQRQFEHREGNSSLTVSLGGNGLPIEDFIDLGLRNLLCQKLYSDVFIPFHPSAISTGPDFMTPLYEEVRRQGPSVVAAKWRACTFMALSKGNKLDKPAIEGHVENLIKEQIQPLFNNLFGQSNSVALTDDQRSQLQDVITAAWELNHILKGEVVTLGDFLPLCCERGVPFDPKTMVEFEASKKRKPGSIAICTIRLGLTLSYAKGSGKNSVPSVVCPATVITPTIHGLNK